jgi:DNA-binding LacI/PurR family transcriptional regulator/DNA-binding transcriptional regulator YhcF (GntR family)
MQTPGPGPGPISTRILSRLRRQVLTGQLTHGMELPSVRKLADLAGIGIVTANRVLKRVEREGWAERHTGRRLRVAADAIRVARERLSDESPPVIYWVTPGHVRIGLDAELTVIIEAYQHVFPGCSFRQQYVDVTKGIDDIKELLQHDARMSAEVGYVLAGLPRFMKEVFSFSGVPCVVPGYVEPDLNLPCVYEDMTQIGRIVGTLLLPCRRPVAICSRQLVGAEIYIVDGFRDAARAAGCSEPTADEFYLHVPEQIDDFIGAIDRLLAEDERPDAILAIRPEYAWAAVQTAARRGIGIPEDLRVVGLHHHPMYRFTYPQITSIGPRSMFELSLRCAEILAEAMGQRHPTAPREVIESTLMERESTRRRMP